WVAGAIGAVPNLLGQYETSLPRSISEAGMMRRFDMGSLGAPSTADGPQLWAASAQRSNGSVKLTPSGAGPGDDARQLAIIARDEQDAAVDRAHAEQVTSDVLTAITPKVLSAIITGADANAAANS